MAYKAARTLSLFLLAGLGFGLMAGPVPGTNLSDGSPRPAGPAPAPQRVAYVAGNLSDEQLAVFSAALAAGGRSSAVVLLDSPAAEGQNRQFLDSYRPERVVPVGSFPDGSADLERRLGRKTAPALPWKDGQPLALWKTLIPRAGKVVVCQPEPRGLLLQAACLAGVLRAPLYVSRGSPEDEDRLHELLDEWKAREVIVAGEGFAAGRGLPGVRVVRLADETAVAAAYLRRQAGRGPIHTLLVANPADRRRGFVPMSGLAPWFALQHRAALLLTNEAGDNVVPVVEAALDRPPLRQADALLLLADLKAIPMERRANPIGGKDQYIEMEPMTPTGQEPFSLATGRLFGDDTSLAALVLARRRLLAEAPPPRKALVASNATGGLRLLEALSRNTAMELRNRGYETTALFGKEVNKDDLRSLMPGQDVILWEGHYNTLIKDYGVSTWTESLSPALVFLQSCLALNEITAQRLLERGAVGVVGTSTRTYAGSGGALALAYFDALLYDGQSLGGSLRQAKNFLLAYSLLKEKRMGGRAHWNGANLRSAWAFSLWGDPTLKLPRPARPEGALPPVRHQVRGDTIVLQVPHTPHEAATSSQYTAQMLPNGRLAGLLGKSADAERRLVPFLFAEVHLPQAPAGKRPSLHSRVSGRRWVFCWDGRRRCGYLLVVPRAHDPHELRFHVRWEPCETLCGR